MPLVDVIIPVYNSARYVGQAVASALAQGVDVHVYVVDDGSSDGSLDRVPDDPRVTKLSQRNLGCSAARNRAIGLGRSPFVAFLDADDYWLEGKLQRQIAAFDRPAVALSCTDFVDFDEAGVTRASVTETHHPCSGRIIGHLLGENFLKPSTVVVRRSALPADGPFDETLRWGEDRDLFYRIAAKHEVAFDPKVLVAVRNHEANVSRNRIGLNSGMARVTQRALSWLERPEHRAAARLELGRVYRELGFLQSTHDLGAALASYARSLRHGGGARAITGMLKAPLRRLLVSPAAEAAARELSSRFDGPVRVPPPPPAGHARPASAQAPRPADAHTSPRAPEVDVAAR